MTLAESNKKILLALIQAFLDKYPKKTDSDKILHIALKKLCKEPLLENDSNDLYINLNKIHPITHSTRKEIYDHIDREFKKLGTRLSSLESAEIMKDKGVHNPFPELVNRLDKIEAFKKEFSLKGHTHIKYYDISSATALEKQIKQIKESSKFKQIESTGKIGLKNRDILQELITKFSISHDSDIHQDFFKGLLSRLRSESGNSVKEIDINEPPKDYPFNYSQMDKASESDSDKGDGHKYIPNPIGVCYICGKEKAQIPTWIERRKNRKRETHEERPKPEPSWYPDNELREKMRIEYENMKEKEPSPSKIGMYQPQTKEQLLNVVAEEINEIEQKSEPYPYPSHKQKLDVKKSEPSCNSDPHDCEFYDDGDYACSDHPEWLVCPNDAMMFEKEPSPSVCPICKGRGKFLDGDAGHSVGGVGYTAEWKICSCQKEQAPTEKIDRYSYELGQKHGRKSKEIEIKAAIRAVLDSFKEAHEDYEAYNMKEALEEIIRNA